MNLLLDTHVALWAITDSPKLSATARALLNHVDATVWISAASLWEIAIKHRLGKGDMPISADAAYGFFRESGCEFLPIHISHTLAIESLPPIHSDPFDRILVAQALTEPMKLLTHDDSVARYSELIIRV